MPNLITPVGCLYQLVAAQKMIRTGKMQNDSLKKVIQGGKTKRVPHIMEVRIRIRNYSCMKKIRSRFWPNADFRKQESTKPEITVWSFKILFGVYV